MVKKFSPRWPQKTFSTFFHDAVVLFVLYFLLFDTRDSTMKETDGLCKNYDKKSSYAKRRLSMLQSNCVYYSKVKYRQYFIRKNINNRNKEFCIIKM